MNKKLIYGLFICMFAFLATNASGQTSWGQDGDFQYTGDGTVINLYDYLGSDTDVVLPETIVGLPVTSVGSIFSGHRTLTSVTIPDSVEILAGTFRNCIALTSVTLPDNATKIDSGTFDNCTSLTSIFIPAKIESIKNTAFTDAINLTSINVDAANPTYTSVDGVLYDKDVTQLLIFPAGKDVSSFTFPVTVTIIGANAFLNHPLTSITLPNTILEIKATAFTGSGLTSITIPASVETIRTKAFRGCPDLTSINVDASNPNYSSIDGTLYNKDGTTLYQVGGGISGVFTIPDGVTKVDQHSFAVSTLLTSVIIPASVTTIVTTNAFGECTSLTSFVVNVSNTDYSSLDGVLYNSDQTTLILAPKGISGHFTIPNTVTATAEGSFVSCELLTSVTIPDSVITLGGGWFDGTFSNCTGLTSVIIPDSVTTLVGPTFFNCTSLTSLHIGSGVATKPNGFLWETTALENLTVDPANAILTSIDDVLYSKDMTELIQYPGGKSGGFTIPDGVTKIGSSSFRGNAFITSVTIPDSVTTVGTYVFSPCLALTDVTIGSGLTAIGVGMFHKTGLTSITIPANITTIKKKAFEDSPNLSVVSFLGNAPVLGDLNAFIGTTSDFLITYTDDTSDFTNPWNGYIVLGPCGDSDVDNDGIGDLCDPNTIYGTISGAVQEGISIDITVYSCGLATTVATAITNAEGYYAVGGLENDSYGLYPQNTDYIFSPGTVVLRIPQTNIQSYDFTAVEAP